MLTDPYLPISYLSPTLSPSLPRALANIASLGAPQQLGGFNAPAQVGGLTPASRIACRRDTRDIPGISLKKCCNTA